VAGVEFALGRGYHLVFFSGDDVCTTVAYGDDAVLRHYVRRTGATVTPIDVVELLIGVEIHKLFIYDGRVNDAYDPTVESPLEQAVHDALAGLGMHGLNILKTRLGYVECIGARASKLQALSAILARNTWSAEHLMAIGDGYNDVEMIRAARVRVAVGNAVSEARRNADLVVATNDQNGVAEALDRVFGGRSHALERDR